MMAHFNLFMYLRDITRNVSSLHLHGVEVKLSGHIPQAMVQRQQQAIVFISPGCSWRRHHHLVRISWNELSEGVPTLYISDSIPCIISCSCSRNGPLNLTKLCRSSWLLCVVNDKHVHLALQMTNELVLQMCISSQIPSNLHLHTSYLH